MQSGTPTKETFITMLGSLALAERDQVILENPESLTPENKKDPKKVAISALGKLIITLKKLLAENKITPADAKIALGRFVAIAIEESDKKSFLYIGKTAMKLKVFRITYALDEAFFSTADLFSAIEKGNYYLVEALIDYNAKLVDEIDADGNTVFHCAVKFNRAEILKLLIIIKNDLKALTLSNKMGETLLHLAAKHSDMEMLNLLQTQSVFDSAEMLNQSDKQGRTALYFALDSGKKVMVDHLINHPLINLEAFFNVSQEFSLNFFQSQNSKLFFDHVVNFSDEKLNELFTQVKNSKNIFMARDFLAGFNLFFTNIKGSDENVSCLKNMIENHFDIESSNAFETKMAPLIKGPVGQWVGEATAEFVAALDASAWVTTHDQALIRGLKGIKESSRDNKFIAIHRLGGVICNSKFKILKKQSTVIKEIDTVLQAVQAAIDASLQKAYVGHSDIANQLKKFKDDLSQSYVSKTDLEVFDEMIKGLVLEEKNQAILTNPENLTSEDKNDDKKRAIARLGKLIKALKIALEEKKVTLQDAKIAIAIFTAIAIEKSNKKGLKSKTANQLDAFRNKNQLKEKPAAIDDLLLAVEENKQYFIEILLNAEAGIIHIANMHDKTLFHVAAQCGYQDMFNLLRRSSVPFAGIRVLKAVDDEGRDALHFAASGGQNEMMHFLLSISTHFSETKSDKKGRTPLYFALIGSHQTIVDFLFSRHNGLRSFFGLSYESSSEFFKSAQSIPLFERLSKYSEQELLSLISEMTAAREHYAAYNLIRGLNLFLASSIQMSDDLKAAITAHQKAIENHFPELFKFLYILNPLIETNVLSADWKKYFIEGLEGNLPSSTEEKERAIYQLGKSITLSIVELFKPKNSLVKEIRGVMTATQAAMDVSRRKSLRFHSEVADQLEQFMLKVYWDYPIMKENPLFYDLSAVLKKDDLAQFKAFLADEILSASYKSKECNNYPAEGRKGQCETILHRAVDYRARSIAAFLLEDASIAINRIDMRGFSALHLALISNDSKMIQLFLESERVESSLLCNFSGKSEEFFEKVVGSSSFVKYISNLPIDKSKNLLVEMEKQKNSASLSRTLQKTANAILLLTDHQKEFMKAIEKFIFDNNMKLLIDGKYLSDAWVGVLKQGLNKESYTLEDPKAVAIFTLGTNITLYEQKLLQREVDLTSAMGVIFTLIDDAIEKAREKSSSGKSRVADGLSRFKRDIEKLDVAEVKLSQYSGALYSAITGAPPVDDANTLHNEL